VAVAPPRTVDTAAPPPSARIAAEWVEPTLIEGDTIYLGERQLTAAELREIRRYRRRLIWEPLRIALPLTLWFGTVLALCLSSGRYPTRINLVFFILLGIVTVIQNVLLVARVGEARLYGADARAGRVRIIRFPLSGDEAARGGGRLSQAIEALPVSGATWTVDGAPALWREYR